MFDTTDTPHFPAAHDAPAGSAFGALNTNLRELDSALTEIERIQLAARKLDAELESALARVDRVARLEAAASSPSIKRGARAAEDSMEYRAARADAATVMHVTEQTVASRLTRAATLASAYPTVAAVLAAGEIDIRHAAVILDAGQVIGPVLFLGDTPDAGLLDAESQGLVDANRAKYVARVLVEAVKTTPARLAPVARRIAEAYALEDLETRYEKARALRRVWVTPKDDGMAELTAFLPIHEAKGCESRLLQMAKRVAEVEAREDREAREARAVNGAGTGDGDGAGAGDSAGDGDSAGRGDGDGVVADAPDAGLGSVTAPTSESVPLTPRRCLNEIKADLFVDLVLNGTGENATGGVGSGTGITAILQVITHETHLTAPGSDTHGESDTDFTGSEGTSRLPLPEIEGCGPIPVSIAQGLAADAGTWSTVNVNLATGTVLTVDTYRPSERIRRFLAARDQRCRFPGCRVPAHRCDYDHTIDAALGGATSTNNLGALCRGHHMLKHHSAWVPKQRENGDYEWTSPTGRTHIDEPASRVRFVPVDELPTCEVAPPYTREFATREPEVRESAKPPGTEDQGSAPSDTSKREGGCPF